MITNPDTLQKFEDEFVRKTPGLSHGQSLKLLAAMWEEGIALGVLPPADPWEGIAVDIKIAQALNACSIKSFPN
jgi:hypothetical protein